MAAWRSYVDPSNNQVYWTDGEPGDVNANYLTDAEYKAGPGRVSGGAPSNRSSATSQYDDYFKKLMEAMYGSNQDYFDWDKEKFGQGLYAELAQALLQGAIGLRGPENYDDYGKYTTGGKNLIGRLFGSEPVPAFGAPTGISKPITIQKILDDLGLGNLGGGGNQPGGTDSAYLDYIWSKRPDLADFYSGNGWDVSTPDKQRAAVWDWIKNVDPANKGKTPEQIAKELGYSSQPIGQQPSTMPVDRIQLPPQPGVPPDRQVTDIDQAYNDAYAAAQRANGRYSDMMFRFAPQGWKIGDPIDYKGGNSNLIDRPYVGPYVPSPVPDPRYNRITDPPYVDEPFGPQPPPDLVPLPHQINPAVWDSYPDEFKRKILVDAMKGKTTTGTSWTAEGFLRQINNARPKGTAPKRVSYNWGQSTPLF